MTATTDWAGAQAPTLDDLERLAEEAFARLRKASQISGRPLKVVAEALLATLGGEGSRST